MPASSVAWTSEGLPGSVAISPLQPLGSDAGSPSNPTLARAARSRSGSSPTSSSAAGRPRAPCGCRPSSACPPAAGSPLDGGGVSLGVRRLELGGQLPDGLRHFQACSSSACSARASRGRDRAAAMRPAAPALRRIAALWRSAPWRARVARVARPRARDRVAEGARKRIESVDVAELAEQVEQRLPGSAVSRGTFEQLLENTCQRAPSGVVQVVTRADCPR